MRSSDLIAVVTSIQPPTECVRSLASRLRSIGAPLLIVGDKKGPFTYELEGAQLFTLEQQLRLPFKLAALLPTGHYARKNLGYLEAIGRGCQCIYETDDDNMPNAAWHPRSQTCSARLATARPWLNVYRLFTDQLIWPRGFPLEKITDRATFENVQMASASSVLAPIQQGLADGSPDVDAVWRLTLDRDFSFLPNSSVALSPGTWCPFNSQTTWWWRPAFPLLYLPSHCSFRMTDIWRSFIAQRCLWEAGAQLVFHASEAVQQRNVHNLLRDFHDEVPGYEGNAKIAALLDGLKLEPGWSNTTGNLSTCYRALSEARFFPPEELKLVDAWLADLSGM